jgi:hypothetical protein
LIHDAKNAQFTDANKVNFTSGSKQMVQVSGSAAAAIQQQDNEQGMVVTTTTLQPQKTITTMDSQAAAILASQNVRVKYVPMKQVQLSESFRSKISTKLTRSSRKSENKTRMRSCIEDFAEEQRIEIETLQVEYEERLREVEAIYQAELLSEQN